MMYNINNNKIYKVPELSYFFDNAFLKDLTS